MPTCSTRAMEPQPVRPEGARPPRLSTLHVGPPVGNHRTIRGADTNPRRSVRHHQRYGGRYFIALYCLSVHGRLESPPWNWKR